MNTINQHITAEQSFDPEALKAMAEAYDRALAELVALPEIAREVVAARIIELAGEGERDPIRLSKAALQAVGVEP